MDVLELHISGEKTKTLLASLADKRAKGGRSDTSSLEGVLDDKSQVAAAPTRAMQFCQSNRLTVQTYDKGKVIRVRKDLLQVSRWR
jgi:hypothetical protein